MEVNQESCVYYRFFSDGYKKGRHFIYNTKLATRFLPAVGEFIEYDYLIDRGIQEGLNLSDQGVVKKVTHVLNTLPETISGKPKRVQNYVLVDIQVDLC